jgi:hypothetical protein
MICSPQLGRSAFARQEGVQQFAYPFHRPDRFAWACPTRQPTGWGQEMRSGQCHSQINRGSPHANFAKRALWKIDLVGIIQLAENFSGTLI